MYAAVRAAAARPKFSPGDCLADDVFVAQSASWFITDAENQLNVTTWGTPTRDAGINAATGACTVRFP